MTIKLNKYSAGSYGYNDRGEKYFITYYMNEWVLSADDELDFDAVSFSKFKEAKIYLEGLI